MTIRLNVFKGEDLVTEYALEGPILKIGRMPSAHVRLEGEGVSRMHAVLESDGGKLAVIDLGSSAGTFVNGVRVNKAALQPGDEIRIGEFRLVVGGDELADIGARLSAVRDEALGLVERGKDAEAVELVCRRAGLEREEAKAYVAGLHE